MRSITAIILIGTASISMAVTQHSNVSISDNTDKTITGGVTWHEVGTSSVRFLANAGPPKDLLPQAVFNGKMLDITRPAGRADCSDTTLKSAHNFLDDVNVSCVDGANSVTGPPFYHPRFDARAPIHSARSIPTILLASEASLDPGVLWFLTRTTQIEEDYRVTPSAGANGSISPSTVQSIAQGATTAFTVIPAAGYTATVGGTCGGSLSGPTYLTNAITADCTVTAVFAEIAPPVTHDVTPSAGANGSINPSTVQSIAQGATTAFTVIPAEGYTATVGGTCGGSLNGTTYTTNAITADCTVSASFMQSAVVDYYAEPSADPEHVPGTFLAHHCHYYDYVSDSRKLLSDASLTDAQQQASYVQHQTVSLPTGNVTLECNADWSAEFKLYVSGWAGQERKDLGLYGLSFFSRIFKDSAIRSEAQAGIWGQWMQPPGSHPFSSLGSIEGGIFSDDKMGRSYYPKYMASGATHLYNGNSSIMGWGFYEKRVGCGYLGGVQIANNLVVPPNLISFDEDQATHEADGGLFFGHAWIALPFIEGKQRTNWSSQGSNSDTSESLGKLSWTFFAEAKNFSGPVYAYVPEFWYRRLDNWNSLEVLMDSDWDSSKATTQPLKDFIAGTKSQSELMSVITQQDWYADGIDEYEAGHYWAREQDTFGFTPAGRISIGAERDNSSLFTETDDNGDVYVKAFLPNVPSSSNIEPHSLSVRSYGVEAYNHFVDFFSGDVTAAALSTNLNAFTHPVSLDEYPEADVTQPGEFKVAPPEEGADGLVFKAGMTMKTETINRGVNLFYDWRNSTERGYSQYYKVSSGGTPLAYQFSPVSENEVPQRLKSLSISNKRNPTSLMPHVKTSQDLGIEAAVKSNTTEVFGTEGSFIDYACWACFEENGCDATEYVTVMDDGSKVKYRWYRFKDQPTFKNLKEEYPTVYTDDYLSSLQAKVEEMQQNWINKPTDFLSKPAVANGKNVNLIELDHGHIVSPPEGKEIGWVPIVLSVEIPHGKWQTEINTVEGLNGKMLGHY